MNTNLIINLIALLILMMFFFSKSKYFLPFFISFNILLPSSLGFIIGNITMSLTRISAIIFPIMTVIMFSVRRTELRKYNMYIILYFLLVISSILSSIYSHYEPSEYVWYLIDDFLQTVGLIYLFIWASRLEKFNLKLIIRSLIIVALFTYSLGIFEYLAQKNIFELFNLSETLNKNYSGNMFRDNVYRISSTFTDTLQFGYFIALLFPIFLLYIKLSLRNDIYYYLAWLCIILTIPLIYVTRSRTSFLMISTAIIMLIGFKIWNLIPITKTSRYIFFISAFTIFLFSTFFFNEIFDYVNFLLGTESSHITDSSLRTRTTQLDYLGMLMKNDNVILGQGRINTFYLIERNYLLALDSMWIRLFLESGIIAPILFLMIFITAIMKLIKIIVDTKIKDPPEYYFLISIILFIIMTTFSSNSEMRVFFYLIIIIASGASYDAVSQISLCEPNNTWEQNKRGPGREFEVETRSSI